MEKIELKTLDVEVIRFILQNNATTIEELCNCFEVSQVNVRNILTKLELFINNNNLGKLIKKNGVYSFQNNTINMNFNIEKLQSTNIDKKERIVYILLKLVLEKCINLTQISKELNISRVTLNGDIDFIKKFIKSFDLELVSVQWKGIFLEGDPFVLQKFSILTMAKLYMEGYFNLNLKRLVNPFVYNYFKTFISKEKEEAISHITNKFYNHFNIQLGTTYYCILKALLILNHLEFIGKIPSFNLDLKPTVNLTETINNLLTHEERKLLSDNTVFLSYYLSQCLYENYAPIYPFDMESILNEIVDTFKLENNEMIRNELALFINSTYFLNRFLVPTYVKLGKEDDKILKNDIALSLEKILSKYDIPFKKKDILYFYWYLNDLISESKKKNVLIIDNGSLNWKGRRLRNKIKHLERVKEVDVISYFNFKFFAKDIAKQNKYKTYIFIDLPFEKNVFYEDKECFFISSYELMKNNIDLISIFS